MQSKNLLFSGILINETTCVQEKTTENATKRGRTSGKEVKNRMSRELFCAIVSLSLDVEEEDAQGVVRGDCLPVGGLTAQLLDRPHDELPLLLVQGEAVAGEEEQEKNRNHDDSNPWSGRKCPNGNFWDLEKSEICRICEM